MTASLCATLSTLVAAQGWAQSRVVAVELPLSPAGGIAIRGPATPGSAAAAPIGAPVGALPTLVPSPVLSPAIQARALADGGAAAARADAVAVRARALAAPRALARTFQAPAESRPVGPSAPGASASLAARPQGAKRLLRAAAEPRGLAGRLDALFDGAGRAFRPPGRARGPRGLGRSRASPRRVPGREPASRTPGAQRLQGAPGHPRLRRVPRYGLQDLLQRVAGRIWIELEAEGWADAQAAAAAIAAAHPSQVETAEAAAWAEVLSAQVGG